MTNISTWVIEHPFTIVIVLVTVGMILLTREGARVVKHRKRRKLIEERKKLRNG